MHDAKTLAAPQIARYRLTGYDRGTEPAHDGGFVHYADHEAVVRTLCEGLMALEAESVEGAEIVGELKGRLSALQEEVGRLRDGLRQIKSLKPKPIADSGFQTGPLALFQAAKRIAREALRKPRALARTAGGKDD